MLAVLGRSSGKFYFEVHPDQLYVTNNGYLTGISVGTGTESGYPGQTTASFGLASRSGDSGTYTNGTQTNIVASGISSTSAYDRIAVDADLGYVWLAKSNRSSGAWIGGGDPAAGTSPTYTFTPGSTIYPMLCPRRGHASTPTDRNRLVAKYDPASWSASAPAGFGGFTSTVTDAPVLGVYNSATPTTDSAIPTGTLNLINTYLDIEWTAEVEWTVQSASTSFYAWSLDGGNHSLRYTGGESGNWILRVNGVDEVTMASMTTSADGGQRSLAGQIITVRAWYDKPRNTRGMYMAVNGVYSYGVSGTTPNPFLVATPTTGYLNSLSGGSPNADLTQIAFSVNSRDASRIQSFNGAVIGDSSVATYNVVSGVPVASLLRSAIDSRNSAIKSLAIGGATAGQQQTNWTAFAEKTDLRWVMIEVGLNDIDPAVSTATSIAAIQSLVTAVNASKPAGCKVYIATMTPCYQRMITRYGAGTPANNSLAKWNDMNDAISGVGGSPITGVDGRITAHTPAMDDGVGNLDAAYDGGDGIHPNNAGRQVIADAWLAQLQADGHL